MLDLNISIEGEKQVSRRLMTASHNLKSYKRPLYKVNQMLRSDIDQNFSSSGKLYGGWQPRKKSYPWRILQKTGKLRYGFESDIGDDQLEISNPVGYFKYHQSNQPRTKLPRRIMMKLRNQDARKIARIFQEYIKDSIK